MTKYTRKLHNKKKKIRKKKFITLPKEIIFNSFKKSFETNYIFYISLIICCIFIPSKKSISNFLNTLWSFIVVSFLGYFSHYLSHKISVVDYYFNSNNIFKHTPIINRILEKYANMMDFHKTIHHDLDINKKYINILYEFLNNFYIQGIGIYFVLKVFKSIDDKICIIWGLLYASFHNINYLICNPSTHRDHHIDDNTNLGIDIYDIIFGTKYNWNDIEDINHYTFNLIIITFILVIIRNHIY